MSEFEEFMRDKISRLRAEADALEKTLKEFTGTKARASSGQRGGGASGGFGAVLEALDEAGTEGLALDQMIDEAALRGFSVNRNTLRSQLWSAKNDGRVEQLEPGRYRSTTAKPHQAQSEGPAPSPPRAPTQSAPQAAPTPPWRVPQVPSPNLDDEIPF